MRGISDAISIGVRKDDPTLGVKVEVKIKGIHTATDTEISRFREAYPIGTRPRRAEPARRPDVRRKNCSDRDGERADRAAQHLDRQPDLKEPPEAAPLLPRRVAITVLDDDLVDRQVDEELQQARHAEDERKAGEVVLRQLTGRDDRGREAENRGAVDPESRRRTTPEEARGHLTGRV